MKVLVTDGNSRVALAVVRALGESGYEVYVTEQERFTKHRPLSFHSKYIKRGWITPPLEDVSSSLKYLYHIAKDMDIVIPISTNTIFLLSQHYSYFKSNGINIPVPDYKLLKRANSKDYIAAFARDIGVEVPETYIPSSLDEVEHIARGVEFPVVIKLRNDEGLYLEPQFRYRIIYSRSDFKEKYLQLHNIKQLPIIQKYIDGEGYGFSSIFDGEKPLAMFCHKRIREYPASGGPSAVCVSVYEQELVDRGIRLLKALKWRGIAMVEFKKDRKDGRFKLMEINPRFWGTLPLALECGVNFPYLLSRMSIGEKFLPVLKYSIGKKMRFMLMDVAAVISSTKAKGKFIKYVGGFTMDIFNPNIYDGVFSSGDIRASMSYLVDRLL